MAATLSEVERRVLGVLIEKALAQPQYYPMTLNAIVAACNQKSNRDPLMELDDEAVWNALEVLRAGGLVTRLLPGGASRVERFKHEAKERLGWEKPQRAVMAELLLRGPQTVGELRSRCARMFPFETTEALTAALESLSQGETAMITALPRAPGQAAVRHAHRLYYPEEWAALTRGADGHAPTATLAIPATPAADTGGLERTVEGLSAEVDALRDRLAELCRRVERLEQGGASEPV